jgi:hypothetical protein
MARNVRTRTAVVAAFIVLFTLASHAGVAFGAPPSITLAKPSSGAWTGNSIGVSPPATDDAGLVRIELWGNGGIFETMPCAATSCGGTTWWTTGALPPGAYDINAVAVDVEGNRTVSATVTIYKDAKSPAYPSGALAGGTPQPGSLRAGFEAPAGGANVCGGVAVTLSASGGSDPDHDDIVTRHFILKIDGSIVFSGDARTPISHQEHCVVWDSTA